MSVLTIAYFAVSAATTFGHAVKPAIIIIPLLMGHRQACVVH